MLTSTQSRKIYNLIDNAKSSEKLQKFKIHDQDIFQSLDGHISHNDLMKEFKQPIDYMSESRGKFEFKSKLKLASNTHSTMALEKAKGYNNTRSFTG